MHRVHAYQITPRRHLDDLPMPGPKLLAGPTSGLLTRRKALRTSEHNWAHELQTRSSTQKQRMSVKLFMAPAYESNALSVAPRFVKLGQLATDTAPRSKMPKCPIADP